jgi:hypothetical protein
LVDGDPDPEFLDIWFIPTCPTTLLEGAPPR